jgi:hypothetical protein
MSKKAGLFSGIPERYCFEMTQQPGHEDTPSIGLVKHVLGRRCVVKATLNEL